MRLHLLLTKPNTLVPYTYREQLTGAIHKWLGKNELHDKTSMYSFSNLMHGTDTKKGYKFDANVKWFISAHHNDFIKQLIIGIQNEPTIAFGMQVNELVIQEEPNFEGIEYFRVASPVFIKRFIDNKEKHFEYHDLDATKYLTETIRTKLKLAGLENEPIEIDFDRNYSKPATNVIKYRNIKNKVNWCPLIIKGSNIAKQFVWNVGVGNSTGIGFGAIQ